MIRRRFLANPRFGTFYAADTGANATTGSSPAVLETDSAPEPAKDPAAPATPPTPPAPPAPPASPAPPAPPAPAAPPAPEPVAQTPKLGLVARVQAAMADKGTLVSQNSSLITQVGDLTKQLSGAKADLSRVTAERDQHAATIGELEKTVGSLNSDKKTVSEATADVVASLGFPLDKLPASLSVSQEENPTETGLNGLYEAFKKETNPEKKAKIHARINAAHVAQSKKN